MAKLDKVSEWISQPWGWKTIYLYSKSLTFSHDIIILSAECRRSWFKTHQGQLKTSECKAKLAKYLYQMILVISVLYIWCNYYTTFSFISMGNCPKCVALQSSGYLSLHKGDLLYISIYNSIVVNPMHIFSSCSANNPPLFNLLVVFSYRYNMQKNLRNVVIFEVNSLAF